MAPPDRPRAARRQLAAWTGRAPGVAKHLRACSFKFQTPQLMARLRRERSAEAPFQRCLACGKSNADLQAAGSAERLQRCSRCLEVMFCSNACARQARDDGSHDGERCRRPPPLKARSAAPWPLRSVSE